VNDAAIDQILDSTCTDCDPSLFATACGSTGKIIFLLLIAFIQLKTNLM